MRIKRLFISCALIVTAALLPYEKALAQCGFNSIGDYVCGEAAAGASPALPPEAFEKEKQNQLIRNRINEGPLTDYQSLYEKIEKQRQAELEVLNKDLTEKHGAPHPVFDTGPGGIPEGSCWHYKGSEVSDAARNEYNANAAAWARSGHRRYDPGTGSDLWIHSGFQPCLMTDNGGLSCTRKPSDSNKHTMFEMSVAGCGGTDGRDLRRNYRYQYGTTICFADNAMDWARNTPWALLHQIHVSAGNPPIALSIKNGRINAIIRGGAGAARNSNFDTFVVEPIFDVTPGECHDFAFQVVMDETGRNGEWIISVDGQEIFSRRNVHTGYSVDIRQPSFGLYTPTSPAGPVTFDNMWFKSLGPV